jgi:hypothetical protein
MELELIDSFMGRVFLETLSHSVVKKFPALMEPKVSLSCLQEPATGSYPEPDASSPHPLTFFPWDSSYYLH